NRALAGAPQSGARRRVLGQCGNGQACIGEASDVFGDCNFNTGDPVGENVCECTDDQCTVTSIGAFTGELTIGINEDCTGGAAGAHIAMRLVGQTQDGVPFVTGVGQLQDGSAPVASAAPALDFCNEDIATACDPDNHSSPFFCSNDTVAQLGDRLTEA